MQQSPTRPSQIDKVKQIKAKSWPFLAPAYGRTEGDLMENARRVIAKTSAHLLPMGNKQQQVNS